MENKIGLADLLPEGPENFPVGKGIKVIRGKTLVRLGNWHKAAVLVEGNKSHKMRLYGWQKNRKGEWKTRQKFNITKSSAERIIRILDYYMAEGAKP